MITTSTSPRSYVCFIACLVVSCATHSQRPDVSRATPQPSPPVVLSVAEAKIAFDSKDALTKALERRWPLAAIRAYCIPERRHKDEFQNLVAYSPRWDGTLYSGVATGWDKIAWYATTKNGRTDQYSLGVFRDKDFWLLEIGDEYTLQTRPDYSPDPSQERFVGHK